MTTQPIDVFGLGQCCLDYLGMVDEYPPPDVKCAFTGLVIQGGGPVATALAALARWGARCAFAGVIGDDQFGIQIRESDPSVPSHCPEGKRPARFEHLVDQIRATGTEEVGCLLGRELSIRGDDRHRQAVLQMVEDLDEHLQRFRRHRDRRGGIRVIRHERHSSRWRGVTRQEVGQDPRGGLTDLWEFFPD